MYAPAGTPGALRRHRHRPGCPIARRARPRPGHRPERARGGEDGVLPEVLVVSSRYIDPEDDEGGDVLEFAILGLLHQTPMHGYELRKQLAQVLGGLRSISYGSLYPALKRLHAAGYVTTNEPDPRALLPADAPPLTGRRGKVVYTITAEGKERFHELVSQAGPEVYDDGGLFGVRLAFFRHTAADVRLRVLEGRRRTVERQREGLRASLSRTRERLDRYTLELQRHGRSEE